MKLPRVRITVRALMVAVAIAAAVSGATALDRRRDGYRERADANAEREHAWGNRAEQSESWAATCLREARGDDFISSLHDELMADARRYQKEAASARRREAYHSRLRRKYEHATSRPWLYVAPDPPEP
jgi:hypothetical protein